MKRVIFIIFILISQVAFADINVVVPFSAGGTFDGMARQFEKFVNAKTSEKINVINVVGAGGYLGLKKLETSPTTIVITSSSFYYIVKERQLSLDSFQYISVLAFLPQYLAVSNTSGLTCAKLQDKTKTYFIGTAGPDSSSSVPAGIIIDKFKHFVEVPYKGVSQAVVDLLGGHIDATFISGNPTERPDLTLLANTSSHSFQGIPSWSKCLGVNNNIKGQFLMLTGPTTNKEFVKKMKQLAIQFVNDPDTVEYFKIKGYDPTPSATENVDKLVREEYNLQ